MKKIILILTLLLVSCSNTLNNQNNEEPNQIQEVTQTQGDNYKAPKNDVIRNDYGCVISNDIKILSTYLGITLEIIDSKVKFIDNKFNTEFYLKDLNDIKSMSFSSDCGGTHIFEFLGENKIYKVVLDYRNDDFEFSENYINNRIKKIETEENYSDLYVCSDLSPETTCKDLVNYVSNDGINFFEYFYYKGENRSKYKGYYNFAYINEDTYLFFNYDRSISKGNYLEEGIQNETIVKTIDNKDINFEFAFFDTNYNYFNYIYVITKEGKLYKYENDSFVLDNESLVISVDRKYSDEHYGLDSVSITLQNGDVIELKDGVREIY